MINHLWAKKSDIFTAGVLCMSHGSYVQGNADNFFKTFLALKFANSKIWPFSLSRSSFEVTE